VLSGNNTQIRQFESRMKNTILDLPNTNECMAKYKIERNPLISSL
jgi:hypothetical protein